MFWGRGNGWVLGGLVEILQALPKDESSRTFYQDLFVALATRVASLQSADGYWHASLLDQRLTHRPKQVQPVLSFMHLPMA